MNPKRTSSSPAFISRSEALDTDYHVYIAAPDAHRDPGPWPVVFVVDGDYFFDPAVEAARLLGARDEIPPVLIAGIGYGAPFGSPKNRRGRDYTPTRADVEPEGGGAGAFLAHLAQSLWPELARLYPVRHDARILAGHSLGGLFALVALFQPEPFFQSFLVGAPSIWWDDRSLLQIVDRFRDRQSTLPERVFIGAGADETPSMVGDLELLRRQLAARPFEGLHVTERTFPGRNHYDVVPDLFQSGLLALAGDSID